MRPLPLHLLLLLQPPPLCQLPPLHPGVTSVALGLRAGERYNSKEINRTTKRSRQIDTQADRYISETDIEA